MSDRALRKRRPLTDLSVKDVSNTANTANIATNTEGRDIKPVVGGENRVADRRGSEEVNKPKRAVRNIETNWRCIL
jgi:hypothetical protein